MHSVHNFADVVRFDGCLPMPAREMACNVTYSLHALEKKSGNVDYDVYSGRKLHYVTKAFLPFFFVYIRLCNISKSIHLMTFSPTRDEKRYSIIFVIYIIHHWFKILAKLWFFFIFLNERGRPPAPFLAKFILLQSITWCFVMLFSCFIMYYNASSYTNK